MKSILSSPGALGAGVGLVVALAMPITAPVAARAAEPPSAQPAVPGAPQMRRGKTVFRQICFACHQMNGQGIPGIYPPLAHSDFLHQHRRRIITILLQGLRGPVRVDGKAFNNVMPQFNLTDRQVADVLTYVSNTWGNHDGVVTEKEVATHRRRLAEAGNP